uniref:Uncharacterized protein n=1 Tax=Anguilla anguilla TaxID=7936 RepID=A0A0E9RT52_ANGAN
MWKSGYLNIFLIGFAKHFFMNKPHDC